jgi:hypothetical protein
MITKFRTAFIIISLALFASAAIPQGRTTATSPQGKPIIFAVLNDGQMIEPIAHIENGKLTETVNGSDESNLIEAFNKIYYPANAQYRLIFGGRDAGSVKVQKDGAGMECGPNLARVSVETTRTQLKGKVMALATNHKPQKAGSGVRRMPTWPERNEIDTMVREEFGRNDVDTSEVKELRYHNLTALDVDGDKRSELVGSFWVATGPTSRALLFFIADRDKAGKLRFAHSEFRRVNEDEVMSGEIASLDDGIYHELLLDVLDIDGDGVSEIFTYVQAFEGSGFNVYKRREGNWEKIFEGSNYHCGY